MQTGLPNHETVQIYYITTHFYVWFHNRDILVYILIYSVIFSYFSAPILYVSPTYKTEDT